jgi:nicotinate-nucleotide adenylyltransferase
VKAKRIPHIRGTEEEAARLAAHWGSDPQRMRRAAILHDCTKYLRLEEHLALCDRYGVELDELERKTEKLLHAKTGAALARHLFGEDDGLVEAICYHTTGRSGMSLEEKILYMADYVEPCRTFPEVEQMRRLAYDFDNLQSLCKACHAAVHAREKPIPESARGFAERFFGMKKQGE